MRSIDKSFDDLFKGIASFPVHLIEQKREWNGSTLNFTVAAKTGPVAVPLKGTIDVTDTDVVLELDLGLLGRLLPQRKVQESLKGRIRGLLT